MSDSLAATPANAQWDGSPRRSTPRRAQGRPSLKVLARNECELHLAEGGIGRVVMSSDRGPVAVPVHYEYADGFILFSTDPAKASRLHAQGVVGFEIDRFDDFLTHGWSVLVTGRARLVEGHGRLSSFGLACWNDGRIHTLVAITPEEVTGRRIV
jgi:Pyridoxamine 5'-phosphate oxidase